MAGKYYTCQHSREILQSDTGKLVVRGLQLTGAEKSFRFLGGILPSSFAWLCFPSNWCALQRSLSDDVFFVWNFQRKEKQRNFFFLAERNFSSKRGKRC